MVERYPGYDVLAKRDTVSWNDATRRAVDARLAVEDRPIFLAEAAWLTLQALCDRVLPQPSPADSGRVPAPLAAYVDRKLADDRRDGYRKAELPPLREAWTRGLAALEAEALAVYAQPFHALDGDGRDALIARMSRGELTHPAWGAMPCAVFFTDRVQPDIVRAYYAHPNAWSEIGFGGPASPRGYVRLDFGKRDPWEAAEAHPGREAQAARENARVGR